MKQCSLLFILFCLVECCHGQSSNDASSRTLEIGGGFNFVTTGFISVDMLADYGPQVRVGIPISKKVVFVPGAILYLKNNFAHQFEINTDFHYNFGISDRTNIYPIIGLNLYHSTPMASSNFADDIIVTEFNFNLGAGIEVAISTRLRSFAEVKPAVEIGDIEFAIGSYYSFK